MLTKYDEYITESNDLNLQLFRALDNKYGEKEIIRTDINKVKELLDSGADIEYTENYDVTPLMWAVENHNKEAVEFLLDNGAKIDAKDMAGSTSLSRACYKGYRREIPEIIKLLIKKGADIETTDNKKLTPLIVASQKNIVPVIKLLLEYGANINGCVK